MKLYLYIFFILSCFYSQTALSQGLKFCGGEQSIDKRTSYDVFKNSSVAFSNYFNIDFKIALYPAKEIGYILRIKNEKSDKIYNLFYDGQGSSFVFKFNEEGRSSLITAELNKEEQLDKHWLRMIISFDLKSDSIRLTVNDRVFRAVASGLPEKYYPIILFGKSDHIIDTPSFAIKELSVGNNEKYIFPLRENEGSIVHDSKGKALGEVLNPQWLINDAYHWSFKTSFKSETVAGANYNVRKKEIYYFNRDAISIYNVRSGETRTKVFDEKCPVNLALGTNFIDTKNNRLYAYEVYHNITDEQPMIASLNLDTYQWTTESTERLPRQLHHHGAYYDSSTDKYTIFGGFGNMYYSKNFYCFDLNERKWSTLDGFSGDTILPRYFSSVGYLKKTNSIYVFGGMGNESGEQVVGRKYFYDLHKVDLNTKHITKLWEIPWDKNNVVPVRGMVILDDSCFYTLCYPEHFSKSFLQLYRFSLKDGSYEILGDSIPIYSDKITTNANLYYDHQLNNLYAIVQEFADDVSSDLKVYSLAFPPITADDLTNYPKEESGIIVLIIIGLTCICIFIIGYLLYRRFVQKNKNSRNTSQTLRMLNNDKERIDKPNSIYLFGEFTVRDRNNKDITYMFSTKLRQMFFLVLQYSIEDGITSQRLSNLIWPDKPEDKVKNSRGVTINHLRKALGELDGIEFVYDKGYFKIVLTDECYCDFVRCIQIISTGIEENREELIEILTRGKFLRSSDQALFDTFKIDMEHKLEPVLLIEIEKSFTTEAYQTTINLTEALFNIDPLNDEALVFQTKALQRLKLNEEARIRYQAFVVEYKRTMGSDYPHPYKDLI